MSKNNEIIKIENLTKTYGKNRGINNISFQVDEGDIYGFLGPNGAGKSTTIRCLLGMLQKDSGNVEVCGYKVGNEQKEILKNVGYLPSESMFYPNMKVSDVIKLSAKIRGLDCSEYTDKICNKLGIDGQKRIRELSLGNRKKISIVCAMQHKPKLLIFDEPTSGLDPLMQEAFFELVTEHNRNGATIFMSSHVLPEVKKYCKHAAIIKEGKIIKTDSVENLLKTGLRRVKILGCKDEIKLPGITDFSINQKNGDMNFAYSGDINLLTKELSSRHVEDVLITEPSLEEIFMHFYETRREDL